MGQPNSVAGEFDFWNDRYEGRRLFSELLGTFFLVLVAVGGGMVSARFGGNAVPYGANVVAPALMVAAIIPAALATRLLDRLRSRGFEQWRVGEHGFQGEGADPDQRRVASQIAADIIADPVHVPVRPAQ
jgi:hypothetical protein